MPKVDSTDAAATASPASPATPSASGEAAAQNCAHAAPRAADAHRCFEPASIEAAACLLESARTSTAGSCASGPSSCGGEDTSVADDWEASADAMAAEEAASSPALPSQPVSAAEVYAQAMEKIAMAALPAVASKASDAEWKEKADVENFLQARGLARCQHVKHLGSGAYGTAALVACKYNRGNGGGRRVHAVLKTLLLQEDGMLVSVALRREALAMQAGAGNPHIIQLYDSCIPARADQPHVLLMEYAAGGTLTDFLVEEKASRAAGLAQALAAARTPADIMVLERVTHAVPLMPWSHLRAFIRGLLGALQQLNSKGWCHGDIKPCNIYQVLDPHACTGRRWVLADLGCATQAVDATGNEFVGCPIPEDAAIMEVGGSPGWCSLEVANYLANQGRATSDPAVTLKSDMASLGLVIAHIIGLQSPADRQALLEGKAQVPDYTPPGLADLVAQLTRVVPSERPSPAAALQHPWLQQA